MGSTDPAATNGQAAPQIRGATGRPADQRKETREQQGRFLTTAQGVRLQDTDHSLRAGARGPSLLQDHHLREKITHFDHERIPERVVHARGAAAHGVFVGYGTGEDVCRAGFLRRDARTPVFVRFSTVLGSRGSADTVRDTRGFATKFYTDEGTFDLVGNNMPVFFIQDGIKFPDIVHAAKPHPDREIPQAQSAHDTFWDFVSLHTEAQHHTIWAMSDRGIARSYRMMEGFGVHTFRCVNAEGETALVKLHWKPLLGVHSLVWEEAQLLAGMDPDFHRRDLADAIEAGAFPQWELGMQVMPDTPEQMFADIDLLDSTKLVPEELAPVHRVGLLTLNANPTNYFAETEQVAFHVGHLVPGIDVTDDPLMQARLFSYVDTQLTRLGGPNFAQIPVNRPHAPVNDMLRDGFHQHAVHAGVAPYHPSSLDHGCPFPATATEGAFIDLPVTVARAPKERRNPASYDDHFSQARLFWLSLQPVERDHVVAAYGFELGKCARTQIRERQLQALAQIDGELCARVAARLGLAAPETRDPLADPQPSPALSQLGHSWPVDGRQVGVLVDEGGDLGSLEPVTAAIQDAGMRALVVAGRGGTLPAGQEVDRTLDTVRSVELDAVLVLGPPGSSPAAGDGAPDPATLDPRVHLLLSECLRHAKAIGAVGAGRPVLAAAGVQAGSGVVVTDDPRDCVAELAALLAHHRVWERVAVPAR